MGQVYRLRQEVPLARIYAGILGPLAFAISVVRGLIHAWSPETTLLTAWVSLWAFAMLGAALGWLAGRIIEEEVRTQIKEK
jgi:hypothetical protein